MQKELDYKINIYKDYSYELSIKGAVDKAFLERALKTAQKKKRKDISKEFGYVEEIPIPSGSFFMIERNLRKGTYQDIRGDMKNKYNLDFISFNISKANITKKESEDWQINIFVTGVMDNA